MFTDLILKHTDRPVWGHYMNYMTCLHITLLTRLKLGLRIWDNNILAHDVLMKMMNSFIHFSLFLWRYSQDFYGPVTELFFYVFMGHLLSLLLQYVCHLTYFIVVDVWILIGPVFILSVGLAVISLRCSWYIYLWLIIKQCYHDIKVQAC